LETSAPYTSAKWAEISPVVSPLADSDSTAASRSDRRRCRLRTMTGSNGRRIPPIRANRTVTPAASGNSPNEEFGLSVGVVHSDGLGASLSREPPFCWLAGASQAPRPFEAHSVRRLPCAGVHTSCVVRGQVWATLVRGRPQLPMYLLPVRGTPHESSTTCLTLWAICGQIAGLRQPCPRPSPRSSTAVSAPQLS
jgi:hypothetical protein